MNLRNRRKGGKLFKKNAEGKEYGIRREWGIKAYSFETYRTKDRKSTERTPSEINKAQVASVDNGSSAKQVWKT